MKQKKSHFNVVAIHLWCYRQYEEVEAAKEEQALLIIRKQTELVC